MPRFAAIILLTLIRSAYLLLTLTRAMSLSCCCLTINLVCIGSAWHLLFRLFSCSVSLVGRLVAACVDACIDACVLAFSCCRFLYGLVLKALCSCCSCRSNFFRFSISLAIHKFL